MGKLYQLLFYSVLFVFYLVNLIVISVRALQNCRMGFHIDLAGFLYLRLYERRATAYLPVPGTRPEPDDPIQKKKCRWTVIDNLEAKPERSFAAGSGPAVSCLRRRTMAERAGAEHS
jgi:hypothetical protein